MPPLKVSVLDAVSNASSEPVIDAASQLGVAQPSWPFLPISSSILEGRALKFAESLFDQNPYVNPSAPQFAELTQYLALATACHVLDGWRYISQSALAFLSGARTAALHLAYYAELRAALGILTHSGVGILKDKHFAVTSSRHVLWFRGSTHIKAWEALDSWAGQSANGLEVVNSFSSLGLVGEEWALATGATASTVGEYWIKNWSIDLHSLKVDKELRNEASYRPNLRSSAFALPSDADIQFVRDVAFATSPVDYGQLDIVNRAVIYDLCRKSYRLLNDPPAKASFDKFWEGVVLWIVLQKGKAEGDAREIVKSLRGAFYERGGRLVISADMKNEGITGVFSRAFLLLRLASALLRYQWLETRKRKTPQDWQDKLILDYVCHSLVSDGSSPTKDYSILGADQEQAISDVDEWLQSNLAFNPYIIWNDRTQALVNLCRFERAGAMAVAL